MACAAHPIHRGFKPHCLHKAFAATRRYTTERHSSLSQKAWVITTGNPIDDLKTTVLASALGIPFEIKQVAPPSWLPGPLRHFSSFGNAKGMLRHIQHAMEGDFPRVIIAASNDALPGLLEVKQATKGRTLSVFLGYPATKLSNIDALVLSRLDQMRLRALGPARADLDNATSTLLPFSGALPSASQQAQAIAVCIGPGMEPAGYRLLSTDVDKLATGLPQHLQIRVLLPCTIHKQIKRMVHSHLIRRLHATHKVEVLDYMLDGQPSPLGVLSSASHVIATADDIASMSMAASLHRPVYIAGMERSTSILRSYYHMLDTQNLVRRFYPTSSEYSYMIMADIDGQVDELSAIRDHEPWAKYDAQADLDKIVSFIRKRFRQLTE
ncbi:hypothetical protein GGI25_002719 [Coemansia spiralis]|uniref:Uncharacterized protein n=2 Tax=Coemansia TaxID=4863 RepID=A0A9W8G9G1_9FUNG|nr:hypothetical protein BX070DRAFT_234609 [Coemansia spiralis]KAJ1993533.1 hypothetical protein EDC05_002160 [Coemansia umbellata]KAJ2625224.1 hypothetical protein GGI26_000693 [Coemansia sp. RSA 1358]KAJ2677930.1 hypothetical protein GGI25_002719 [Coemansia spiralis]